MRLTRRLLFLCALPVGLAAQEPDVSPVLGEADEIELARSAAPEAVSNDASVFVLRGDRYELAVRGTNGVECMVGRSQPASLEPICYDPEAARTIRPILQARVEMRLRGAAIDEIEARIDSLIDAGQIELPERPAMAYMMSPRQVLYADAETRVGAWRPHYHIFMPFVTAAAFGGSSGDEVPGVGRIVDAGKATANLVIAAEAFTSSGGD